MKLHNQYLRLCIGNDGAFHFRHRAAVKQSQQPFRYPRLHRGIIANQRKRMVLNVVLCAIILAALAFFSWRMNEAYVNVMDACNRVNDLADTVQTSLDTLDQAQLDSMMQDLPEITAQLKKVDVDALNKVLTELPALMDTVNSLQTQVQNISNWFSSLGSVFGR